MGQLRLCRIISIFYCNVCDLCSDNNNITLTVPSGAPRNLQATAITETSISIQWDEIECLEQNGAIIRYSILLNSNPLSTTLPNVREFTLTGLSPQTSYTISVFGANGLGNGTARSITILTAGRPG